MSERVDYIRTAPEPAQELKRIEDFAARSGLDRKLIHLMKLRASQMNGCAYCIVMHSRELRSAGETAQRLDALSVWSEVPVFDAREQAALAWTEALTDISGAGVPDSLYRHMRELFSEEELVALSWVVTAINVRNRMAIAFRSEPIFEKEGQRAREGGRMPEDVPQGAGPQGQSTSTPITETTEDQEILH